MGGNGSGRRGTDGGAVATGAAAGGRGGGTNGGGAPPSACGTTPFTPPTGGKSYYVAPTGSDSAAGTMAAPFLTMKQASKVARGGDLVYLRDGVYSHAESFTPTGAAGNPVVFMAMPGEHPILDGAGLGFGKSDSILQLYEPSHAVIAGLELRNSDGRGLQLIDADDVVIRDCVIHDVAYKALGLNGHGVVAEGNVIYNAVLTNKGSGAGSGWAAAVTTQLLEDGSPSGDITLRGNLLHDNWGECVTALYVDGMTISGNDVRDCFSVGIYVNTARAIRVEGNVVRASDAAYMRNGHLMDGILLASEHGDASDPDWGADDVVVANNIVLGVHNGVSWWDDDENSRASNSYRNLAVVGNVVWASQQYAIMFDQVPSGRATPSATLTDNILYASSKGSVQLGDTGAWTITHNVFPDGKPAAAGDATNLAVDPQLSGTPAVDADAAVFRPAAASPCRHAGLTVAAVPLDFACAARGASDTTIGAFE